MENVRRINKWTRDEDNILIQRLLEQQQDDPTGTVTDWQKVAAVLPGRSNKDCRKRWFNVLSGGLRKGAWTAEEDSFLRNGVQVEGKSWMRVAQHVPQRTADQCAKRWQHFLDPALDRSEWSIDENERLLRAVEQHGRRWLEIRDHYLPLRSPNALKNQYSILLRRHEKRLAATRKEQGAMEVPPSDYQYEFSQDQTASVALHKRWSISSDAQMRYGEAEGYIKQEPDDDIVGFSFSGGHEYQPTNIPATHYDLRSKSIQVQDPLAGRYSIYPKQEGISVAGYDTAYFCSEIGTTYDVSPVQLSGTDAGILERPSCSGGIWMTYPTSPSSSSPSDNGLGGFHTQEGQWNYGTTVQHQSSEPVHAYGGYQ